MAILPVYTTSKLHAARINLRQTPSSTPGYCSTTQKGVVLAGSGRGLQKFSRTPLHEILDPPLSLEGCHFLSEYSGGFRNSERGVQEDRMLHGMSVWFSTKLYSLCKVQQLIKILNISHTHTPPPPPPPHPGSTLGRY